MKKRLPKPLLEPSDYLPTVEGLPPDQRPYVATDAEEARRDRAFVNMLSRGAIRKAGKAANDTARARDFESKQEEYNSIPPWSGEALFLDRVVSSKFREFWARVAVASILENATAVEIRRLRIAFELGRLMTEAEAYRTRALGRGRSSTRDALFQAFDASYARWRKANPGTAREPSARELVHPSRYLGPLMKPTSLRSRVSEWRKCRKASPK